MKQDKRKKSALIAVVVVVIFWLTVGAGFVGYNLATNSPNNQAGIDSSIDGNQTITVEEADLEKMVKQVSPSVVSIVTSQTSGRGLYQQEVEGAGTGIIISENGYILTNRHVVQDASSVQVVTNDGTRYQDVKLVGFDPSNDIAFLKINGASGLSVASLGDSSTVRVGQGVVAIGNSLGQFNNTVTSGIISGLGRPIVASSGQSGMGAEALNDLIQTDAAINPGNSGGPLINMAGQVVGINTATVTTAQGLGFAIPINAAKGLVRGVLKDGTIQKSFIGVQYLSITPDVKSELKLSEERGALIHSEAGGTAIVSGGPAEKAGLKLGDIITKINDQVVGESSSLSSIASEFLPGEVVKLTVVRDGKTQTIDLTLGTFPSQN